MKIFKDGVIVALLNPKTTIFFAAFLPQFISSSDNLVGQSILLGVLFVTIAASTDALYAVASGMVAPVLGKAKRLQAVGRYMSGGTYIGLGVLTACSSINQK